MKNIITISAPSGSGKTTLCKALANELKIPFCKEYAREYLELLKTDYSQADLMIIAKKQFQLEKKHSLLDTDLITIKIWSTYKYKSCNKWILEEVEKQKSEERFYLLCKPDIDWEPDPLRESPNNRIEIFELYKKELEELKHNYFIVEGENRLKKSISKISTLIY